MKDIIIRQKNGVYTEYKEKADEIIMYKTAIHDIPVHETITHKSIFHNAIICKMLAVMMSILVCIGCFMILRPVSVSASEDEYIMIQTYEQLKAAAVWADGTSKYRLANDIYQKDTDNSNEIKIHLGTFHLDLNGYTLHRKTQSLDTSLFVLSAGEFVLTDSSKEQTGTCIFENDMGHIYRVISNTGGELSIYGGRYILKSNSASGYSCALWLESGHTYIYDGCFDTRQTDTHGGRTIVLTQMNAFSSVPVCVIEDGEFYSGECSIHVSPYDRYIKYGSVYAPAYVLGGKFYLSKVKEDNGGFAYCNNGWGRVIVAEGTILQYSLNYNRDVNYLPGTIKISENIAIDTSNRGYYHVVAPPTIVSSTLPLKERLLRKCMRMDYDYYCETNLKNTAVYEKYGEMMEKERKALDVLEVSSYEKEAPLISLERTYQSDTIKWYYSSAYEGSETRWEELTEYKNITSGWRFEERPEEETTVYVRCEVSRPNGEVAEDIIEIHYNELDKRLVGTPMIYMNNPRYGNAVYAGVMVDSKWHENSTFTYEWRVDGVTVGKEQRFVIDKKEYIGCSLECVIKSTKYTGMLVTPAVTITKAKYQQTQTIAPGASYDAENKSITLTSLSADQEYLFTTKEKVEDLTNEDWRWTKQPVDTTGTWKLSYVDMEAEIGNRIYIYTRLKETDTHEAGEKIIGIPLLLAKDVYLTQLEFKDSINQTVFIPFTQKGDQVRLNYSLNPINANQWTTFSWVNPGWPVRIIAPTEGVTPQNNIGGIILELVDKGTTNLLAYTSRGDMVANIKVVVYDPENPSIGSVNVVEKLPDRTVEAGTAFTMELPEFIPEPPESMEFLWFFTIDKQGGKQTYTENEIAVIEPESGEIKALAPGKVSVSLMKPIESGYYELDTFELTVVEHGGIIPVSQILLDKTKVTIMENEVAYLKTAVVPENASNQNVVWSSSDAKIVKVEQNGKIRGVSKGTATITAAIEGKTVSCQVTVKENIYAGGMSELENPFTDVKESDYYYDAVLWAVDNSITAGLSEDNFAPNATCSRAQAVTFLWRAAGSPTPQNGEMPFTDVPDYAYYKDAVLWAVQEGITAGYTPTTFCPDMDCTRGQIVSFLWRSQKSPEVTADNPFVDVSEKAYYYKAVLWAVKEGITAGYTPTTFCPDMDCTRAQIVTFLYRYMTF